MLPVSVDQQFREFEVYLRASHLIINLGGYCLNNTSYLNSNWRTAFMRKKKDVQISVLGQRLNSKVIPLFTWKNGSEIPNKEANS